MRRTTAGLLLVALLAFAWAFLPEKQDDSPTSGAVVVAGGAPGGRSRKLAEVRRRLDTPELDAFVADQEALTRREPDVGEHWRVLAEAYLERALLPDVRLGLVIGRPNRDELPPEIAADVGRGMGAIERAFELGDETSEAHRVHCALLSRQILGLASLLKINGRLDASMERAVELDESNPRVLVTLGCRKLFAPRLFGHDPEGSLPYLLAGADALESDERPLLYAAFACWLLEDYPKTKSLLARAAERTPHNPFSAEVLRRLEAGEEEPFRSLDPLGD